MGVEFYWTLNQEVLFSLAITGKPMRRTNSSKYLAAGNAYDLSFSQGERLVLSPASNTDYLNASAFVEAFWSYLCYVVVHGGQRPREHGEWVRFVTLTDLGKNHMLM